MAPKHYFARNMRSSLVFLVMCSSALVPEKDSGALIEKCDEISMISSPVVNFTNILSADFSYKIFVHNVFVLAIQEGTFLAQKLLIKCW
jgi:hypothetical protein